MNREKATYKDFILKSVNKEKVDQPDVIAKNLNVDKHLIRYLCEELGDDGLLDLTEVTSLESGRTCEYLMLPTNKGIQFLNFDGGFIREYHNTVWNRRFTIAKTVAATLNALAILIIAALSLYFAYIR